MSLSFTGLERLEGGQQGIEGFFGSNNGGTAKPATSVNSPKRHRSPSPMIKPKIKPGAVDTKTDNPTIEAMPTVSAGPSPKKPRLPTLHTGPARKTVLDSFLSGSAKRGESSTSTSKLAGPSISKFVPEESGQASIEVVDFVDDEDQDQDQGQVDNANRAWICPKCGFEPSVEDGGLEKLAEVRQEHEDFHFAQDLQQAGSSPIRAKTTVAKPKAKVKKKKEEGIKAFFTPKAVKKE
jgi:DNA polymerase eta